MLQNILLLIFFQPLKKCKNQIWTVQTGDWLDLACRPVFASTWFGAQKLAPRYQYCVSQVLFAFQKMK